LITVGEPDLKTLLFSIVKRKRQATYRLPFCGFLLMLLLAFSASCANAQAFRFGLRADPDVIPANGISTSSILVQVQDTGNSSITAAPIVRFITSAGTIEGQSRLSGGIARVLLRSSTTPGTAIITAFVGNAREQIAVEFTADSLGIARYIDVSGSYVAYSNGDSVINSSGKCVLNFGDTHIESDVRLDVDLRRELVWAEGNPGTVLIRQGRGEKAKELRGDRLYYDLRRRRGVIRRMDTTLGPARQEFMGNDFRPLPRNTKPEKSNANPPAITPVRSITPVDPAKALEDKSPIIDSTSRVGDAAPAASAMQADAPPLVEPPTDEATASEATPEPESATVSPQTVSTETAPATTVGSGVRLSEDERHEDDGEDTLLRRRVRASLDSPAGEGPRAGISTLYRIEDGVRPGAGGMEAPGAGAAIDANGRPNILAVLPSDERGPAPAAGGTKPTAPGDTTGAPQEQPKAPVYSPLENAEDGQILLVEQPPPYVDVDSGYWVAARRMLVYPNDKIQCEKATLFYNGGKVFSMPRYVVPLNGSFNPAQDMVSFNTAGGLTLNVPYYYMASPQGQGTIYFQHAPKNGFASESPGFALAVEQQYWLSEKANGKLLVDQLGQGAWNLGWEHKMQLSPTMNGRVSLDMPRHRNAYLRTALYKELDSVQLGMEGFYSRLNANGSSADVNDIQGQFFARLRPRQLGHSGWYMTLAANLKAWNRYPLSSTVGGGGGGGIGLPGRPGGGTQLIEKYRPVFGQTLDLSLQGPQRKLWKGANLQTTLNATAFNDSLGRRGVAPGWTFGFNQNLGRYASMNLSYVYDKSSGITTGTGLSHFLSGSMFINPTSKVSANLFATKSLTDRSLYGSAGINYNFSSKWRAGLFTDYSTFPDVEDTLDYGWSLGRMVGQREISVNWSAVRNRIYFELGGFRY
jgi:hypothetical protein